MVAKVFQQFPGDFGAMGQDSIVGQSFILLNAKKRFLPTGSKIICGTNVHLAHLKKVNILSLKGRRFRAGCKLGSGWICAACIWHVNDPKGFGGFGR